MSDIRFDTSHPTPPADPGQGTQQTQQETQQAQQKAQQADQQKQAQEAQRAAETQLSEARRAALEAIHHLPQPTLSLPQEFMGVIENIVREGYETAKPSEGGKMGDQGQEGPLGKKSQGLEFQKELQTLREFVREAKYLINNQGMEIAQMLNTIKVEQGGAFWQKIQQILQKGIPLEKMIGLQKGEKVGPEGLRTANLGAEVLPKGALGAGQGVEGGQGNPGKAVLEMIRGELNPQASLENFLVALQILNRGGLQQSSQRLLSYLRRRGGFSQQEWGLLLKEDFRKEIWQGPMPREEIQPVHWWYVLLALGVFGASLGLGLNLLEASAVGGAVAVLMFVLSFVLKK